jgi:hypothetical protein
MMRLQKLVTDPEDLYLMHSMFKLVGYNVRDPDSGEFELQTTMLENNAAHFWKCFLRVLRCLHVAQYKLGASAQEELTSEEEAERATAEVRKLIRIPGRLDWPEAEAQRLQLPMIKNLVGYIPGRGIPVRQRCSSPPPLPVSLSRAAAVLLPLSPPPPFVWSSGDVAAW